jgi:catechol-2,3-dioxygenase
MKLGAIGLLINDFDILVSFYKDVIGLKQNIDYDGFAGFEIMDVFYLNICKREIVLEENY